MTAVLSDLFNIIAHQAAEIDSLKGEKQALEQAMQIDRSANVQAAFGVSETLAHVLILLSDGKPRSKEALHSGLYYRRPEVDQPEQKILDTIASKLRKSVRQYGIEIETIWSGGLQIVAGLRVVQSAMEFAVLDPDEAARRRRLEREKERQRRLRAERGCTDRQTYLQQALSRNKPWLELGISRRQWERRRHAAGLLAANSNDLATSQINDSQAA